MTRTERAGFPKAMLKDRSESRSGLDKSLRKNGAGQHNWGRLADERQLEFLALDDEAVDMQQDVADDTTDTSSQASDLTDSAKPAVVRSVSNEDVVSAKEFRKNVFKGDVDLAAIARTSAAVSSSPREARIMHASTTQV